MANRLDAIIVGGGPSGCRTAELIAKKGYEVLVLEEHSEIGSPAQCTGLVSSRIGPVPKRIVKNKIKTARFCCGSRYFDVKSKKPAYVLDRRGYDQLRASLARKAGAQIKASSRFNGFDGKEVSTTSGKFEAKILIGADGPNSSVARAVNLRLPENLLNAVQVRAASRFDPSCVELWFGQDIAPGLFAWVVPEDEEIARVGLMTEGNPNKYLEKFLKQRLGNAKTSDFFGDVSRYGFIERSCTEKVMLVGDAACQIKPFSMGGIIYGQIGAQHAADAVIKSMESDNFSGKFLMKNYDKTWKRELQGPIRKGIFMKRVFASPIMNPFTFSMIQKLNLTRLSSFLDMDFLEKG